MVIAEPLYWFGHSLYKRRNARWFNLDQVHEAGIIHFMLYPNAAKEGKVLETLERIVLDEFFSVVEVTRFLMMQRETRPSSSSRQVR